MIFHHIYLILFFWNKRNKEEYLVPEMPEFTAIFAKLVFPFKFTEQPITKPFQLFQPWKTP